MNTISYKPVGAIYLFPFVVFFLLAGLSILHTNANQESSTVNQIVDSLAYVSAFIILWIKQRGFFIYALSRSAPLLIMLFFALLSILWTEFPRFLLMGFVHKVGASFIAISAASLLAQNINKFFNALLVVFFFYFVATIIFSFIRPDMAQMPATLYGEYRAGLRGFTLHPNTLGAICVDGVWISISSLFLIDNKNKTTTVLAVLLLICASYCLVKADSMTSILVSLAMVFIIGWCKFIRSSSGSIRLMKIILVMFSLFMVMASLFVFKPEIFTIEYFFKAIGRDSTFTGRASLWETALNGFYEKPIFGWGEDNLLTFHKHYHQSFGQLHNGYFDLLVRGGIVAIVLFLIILLQIYRGILRLAKSNNQSYILILSFISVWLVHNVTEASIFKSPNVLWLFCLVLYFFSIGFDYQFNRSKYAGSSYFKRY
ncbi:hypothetical protein [Methylomonas albis]|uniref:O-antigen ligase family protein n=1 Tax=Methylomonas albis TaxID=1854563 RepID=A0ABR9D912_9GAMM|nr:O-antigen ligase family protein [Methylomonas albis]MBD9358417.1 O-antigen ligase family protein [Methylomonas albis]CAD6881819.1 hypothetical protein [Methylomonas albis]